MLGWGEETKRNPYLFECISSNRFGCYSRPPVSHSRKPPTTMTTRLQSILLLLLAFLASPADALKLGIGRRALLGGALSAASLSSLVAPARADTKKYKEACLSKCVADQQSINKGIAKVEYVDRKEAIAVCKPKCVIK